MGKVFKLMEVILPPTIDHSSKHVSCFKEFAGLCKKSPLLRREIETVALIGSAGADEAVVGWSDLDILVVVKSSRTGNVSFKVVSGLKATCEHLSAKYSFPVSILPHSVDDFKNYVSFEYLYHYNLTSGSNLSDKSELGQVLEAVLRSRAISEETRKRYCIYHLRHLRFNLTRKYVSLNKHNSGNYAKELGKLVINNLFKTCDLLLNFFDIWPVSKRDIVNLVSINYPDVVEPPVLENAAALRSSWDSVAEVDILDALPNIIKTINKICDYLVPLCPEPTPEEDMSR